MKTNPHSLCVAFAGNQRLTLDHLNNLATEVKRRIDAGEQNPILIFDDVSSEPVELDFRGSLKTVLSQLPAVAAQEISPEPDEVARAPGRPKLGVIAREVTLLPRHWEWLAAQSGGASVALRKLVEVASRAGESKDRIKKAQEATYRFMAAMAGNLPGFEEAVRALYAMMPEQFGSLTEEWPVDIRDHARRLALRVFVADQ